MSGCSPLLLQPAIFLGLSNSAAIGATGRAVGWLGLSEYPTKGSCLPENIFLVRNSSVRGLGESSAGRLKFETSVSYSIDGM
jgi:hypothetical protein